MKAHLEFDLPTDQGEFDLAINARALWSVLWEFDQELRDVEKHGQAMDADGAEMARETLWKHLDEEGIRLDMLG